MTDKDLSRALLDLDSPKLAGVADVREQTWKILERDRNRVWWWTASTFAMWAIALFMVMAMMVAYALVFPLQAHLAKQAGIDIEAPTAAASDKPGEITPRTEKEVIDIRHLTPEQLKTAQFNAQIMFQMVTVGVAFSVGLTCLAVLASVMLSRASRRATLRQINASLLEISEQLKELRKTAPPPTS
ncbi:MAG TPA: hypothetical protein VGI40_00445 [Pirellulaceae bacterium]|jgi:hypothetical protein